MNTTIDKSPVALPVIQHSERLCDDMDEDCLPIAMEPGGAEHCHAHDPSTGRCPFIQEQTDA